MMENKCFEKITFAFFDFCEGHRLASFVSIFATVVALAGIAAAICQSGSDARLIVGAIFRNRNRRDGPYRIRRVVRYLGLNPFSR